MKRAIRKSLSHRGMIPIAIGMGVLPIYIGTGYLAIKKQILDV
jgi:hypothetical protein